MNLISKVINGLSKRNDKLREIIHPSYKIPGLVNFDKHPIFSDPNAFPNFKPELERFKDLILNLHSQKKAAAFYKFGDGDYFFLKGIPHGSAKPGNRALSRELSEKELSKFQNNATGADFYLCEIYPENRDRFRQVFPSKTIDFPAEFSYICISSNWFVRNFQNIGLIGAAEKIDLIRELSQKSQYKNALGFDGFSSFISVPQKFSCDDLDAQLASLKEQLSSSCADIYLIGIGHLKSGVLGELKKYKDAIYIDVGSGIDALAGIIDTERPYFGSWTNFQLREFNYEQLDFLNYNGKNVEHI